MNRNTIAAILLCLPLPFVSCDSETMPTIEESVQISDDSTAYLKELQHALELACEDATMDSALVRLEGLMLHDSILAYPRLRHNALEQLVNICRDQNKDEKMIYWANQLLEVDRQLGFTVSGLNTETEIGMALTRLGKTKEGLAMISNAITGLDDFRKKQHDIMAEEAQAELARKNTVIFCVLIFVVVSSILSLYFYRVRRNIALKNKALVKMITEYEDSKARKIAPAKCKEPEDSMFQKIDSYVRSHRLYADPNLQRQDVLDHFSINKNTLNSLFNEHNGGLSFPAYINNIRLEEGQLMLRNNPEATITEIAKNIGFTAPNFREQFKKKYGITPTEFRQSL